MRVFGIESALIGEKELIRRLNGMESALDSREFKRGMFKAGQVLASEGRRQILERRHKRKGALHASLRVRLVKRKGAVVVGFDRHNRVATSRGFVSNTAWINEGTGDRYTNKGAYRGRIKADPYWDAAIATKGQKALDTLVETTLRLLERKARG